MYESLESILGRIQENITLICKPDEKILAPTYSITKILIDDFSNQEVNLTLQIENNRNPDDCYNNFGEYWKNIELIMRDELSENGMKAKKALELITAFSMYDQSIRERKAHNTPVQKVIEDLNALIRNFTITKQQIPKITLLEGTHAVENASEQIGFNTESIQNYLFTDRNLLIKLYNHIQLFAEEVPYKVQLRDLEVCYV